MPISRKALGYVSDRAARDAALVKRLSALAEQYPRCGYLMRYELLRREGQVVNRKRTCGSIRDFNYRRAPNGARN